MITSTIVVPPKKPISTTIVKKTAPSSNTLGKLKDLTNIGSSSKSKNVASKISINLEPKPMFLLIHLLPMSILGRSNHPLVSGLGFGNDHVAAIRVYGNYHIGNIAISQVYYVERLGHNLFLVGQFCDSDLEVAFRKHTCFVCDLEGVDLLKGSRGSNLYTLSLEEMMQSSLICLLSKASKTKTWLWHRRLSHLNFDYINELAKQGLVRGLTNLKYQKDHLCSASSLGKNKKHTYKPKSDDSIQEKLYLLHMDMYGPIRIESISGKKYILVIVDDYSRFTWVKFLRSKDETPKIVIKLLKYIHVCLHATVRNIRADNGTEFVNQTLAYYDDVGISHQTLVVRTPQQNVIVER
ncbi:retrovirus-related pol polyprotein from transposon TNT 1-94 [Tanacetum coccineum]|uniref:Retrovirus-related pol polyprotein from transposon TNT 1-94 n=1 Tax=Tanacetum coccineum TaxID=301880 RepID=A0ABQ5FFM2_9ASTR